MQAIAITEPGGPEVLKLVERPRPTPTAGEVLIEVAAAGVNRPDLMQREGRYPAPEGASELPGLEVAGTVREVGEGVEWPPLGTRVMALLAGGGYAEWALAPAGQCLPWPDSLSAAEAGGLCETLFTVWANVFEAGQLSEGETFLVHGGASGIGTTAIQLAALAGARVGATVRRAAAVRPLLQLGAERVFVEGPDAPLDWKVWAGKGVDVVLDMLGGPRVNESLMAMAPGGRHVSIAFLTGREAQIDLARVMRRRLTLTGSTLRPRSVEEKEALRDALRGRVLPWIQAGHLRPPVEASFPLAEAAEAHRRLEAGGHVGKIVLLMPS